MIANIFLHKIISIYDIKNRSFYLNPKASSIHVFYKMCPLKIFKFHYDYNF